MAVQRWDYRVIRLTKLDADYKTTVVSGAQSSQDLERERSAALESTLLEMGHDGWETTGFIHTTHQLVVIFKRPA